jgi:drug/metabolite transporter (DMT)-like permease
MPRRPALVALAGALCIAFSSILVRLANVEPSTAAFFRCAYAVPFLGALAWLEHRRVPRTARERALAVLAGAFFAADLILWHHAIAAVGAGLATVLANVQVVLVPVAAWAVLAERPSARLVAAVPVVLAGVVLISGAVGAGAYGSDPALGVLFGLLTGVAYAAFLLTLRAGTRGPREAAGPLFEATAAAALGCLVAGALLGELQVRVGWEAHAWLVTLALTSQVLGWLLITASMPRLPAALVAVLLTIQPATSVLLAMALLDERPSPAQLAGVGVVIGGVVVATQGWRRRRPAPLPT